MLKPERKSPSIPTVEMVSPFKICAVHKEIIFDPLMHALGAFTIGSRSLASQPDPTPLHSFPEFTQASRGRNV